MGSELGLVRGHVEMVWVRMTKCACEDGKYALTKTVSEV